METYAPSFLTDLEHLTSGSLKTLAGIGDDQINAAQVMAAPITLELAAKHLGYDREPLPTPVN
jgi:hypothetical protein